MANSFLYDNKLVSVGGILSCTNENALYPLANLIDYNAAKVFRTNSLGAPDFIVFDFGSAVQINTVGLANCNFSSAGSVIIQASTTDTFAATPVNETINMSNFQPSGSLRDIYHKLAASYSYQYWRLRIDDSFATSAFYEIGQWFLGVRVSLASGQDFELPWTRSFPDPNVMHQTEWLQDYVYLRDVKDIQTIQIEYRAVTLNTATTLRNLKRAVKNSGFPFFFCPIDTDIAAEGFFVRMIGDFEITQETSKPVYSVKMTLRELARGLALPSAA